MKKSAGIILLIVGGFLQSCGEETSTAISSTNDTAIHIVGNDQDSHGCKSSAGYTWSVLKNDCIRSFELPNKLTFISEGNDSTEAQYAAYYLFSDDSSRVEIFLKEELESIILSKVNSEEYNDVSYQLKLTDHQWYLLKDNELLYHTEN